MHVFGSWLEQIASIPPSCVVCTSYSNSFILPCNILLPLRWYIWCLGRNTPLKQINLLSFTAPFVFNLFGRFSDSWWIIPLHFPSAFYFKVNISPVLSEGSLHAFINPHITGVNHLPSLSTDSWSKYVWELRCPAAESPVPQSGTVLGPTVRGVGQSSPGG